MRNQQIHEIVIKPYHQIVINMAIVKIKSNSTNLVVYNSQDYATRHILKVRVGNFDKPERVS